MEDHTLLTRIALNNMPISQQTVTVTTLESFLTKNRPELSTWLEDLEHYLQKHIKSYPARPEELKFNYHAPNTNCHNIVKDFLTAIRVNPNIKIDYYIKTPRKQAPENKTLLTFKEITDYHYNYPYALFFAVNKGEEVKALDVLATASDEPDYGMDIGLFEDNNTSYGDTYKFGRQTTGNIDLSYSSQLPFHMGFFHESLIVYWAAPIIGLSYIDVRAIMFALLGVFAFKAGSPYWGYRFTGWGLHYIQDLTMPFHAALVPGKSTLYLLGVTLLHKLGITVFYNGLFKKTINKHLLLEMLQLERIHALYSTEQYDHPIIRALQPPDNKMTYNTGPVYNEVPFSENSIKNVISLKAKNTATKINTALKLVIKDRKDLHHIQNIYNITNYNIYDICHQPGTKEFDTFQEALIEILRETGLHTRSYVAWVFQNLKNLG